MASKVTATAAAFPGRDFVGTVTGVDSRIDPITRSVTVRARHAERRPAR